MTKNERMLSVLMGILLVVVLDTLAFGGVLMAVVFAVKGKWLFCLCAIFCAFAGVVALHVLKHKDEIIAAAKKGSDDEDKGDE